MSVARDLAALANEFLVAIKRGTDTERYRARIAELTDSELATLGTDDRAALAFWINLYNAFVQHHLETDPSVYDDRRRFFGDARIVVAGTSLGLDDIEHGLLRSSRWKYGLGYVPRPLPSAFERAHRRSTVDPRVHFALNCGAESCPPVAAYTAEEIDAELDASTRSFLGQSSRDDADEVWVTRLFLYYRGDFGGRDGIYEFLERYGMTEVGARPRVRYEEYDWTIHRGMYRDGSD